FKKDPILIIMKNFNILFILLFIILVSCDRKPTMADIIKKTAEEQFHIPKNIYASTLRIAYFDSLSRAAPKNQKEHYNLKKADALLYAGRTKEAIEILGR